MPGPTRLAPTLGPPITPPTDRGGLLSDMAARLPYDGLWLDMNEPSNFCTGQCRLRQSPGHVQGGGGAEAVNGRNDGNANSRQWGKRDVADEAGIWEGARRPETVGMRREVGAGAKAVTTRPAARLRLQQLGISCDLDCTAPR